MVNSGIGVTVWLKRGRSHFGWRRCWLIKVTQFRSAGESEVTGHVRGWDLVLRLSPSDPDRWVEGRSDWVRHSVLHDRCVCSYPMMLLFLASFWIWWITTVLLGPVFKFVLVCQSRNVVKWRAWCWWRIEALFWSFTFYGTATLKYLMV